ncbi:MAG: hypothetical protein ACHQQQ_03715 [Bacteroidota bacterium]
MYIIRDVMHCKPGMVKDLVQRFKEANTQMKKVGYKGEVRIMTDVSGERYWTAVMEVETDNLEKYQEMINKSMADAKFAKSFAEYHKFVDSGHREIYKVEG